MSEPIMDCEAGHAQHDTITLQSDLGCKMEVYNWEKYKDQPGVYCPGQDDVSRTIFETGNWARDETKIIKRVLEKGPKKKNGLVLDFGAHIGWYSIMAARMGYDVIAIEAVWEHMVLLYHNIDHAEVADKVHVEHMWVDENVLPAKLDKPYKEIWFVKIDLEGNEQYAIQMLEPLLKKRKIANIFMEVSPVFNKSYPELVERIQGYGYHAYKDGKKFDGKWNFDQSDILFKRKNS